jgi:hypothetical protein
MYKGMFVKRWPGIAALAGVVALSACQDNPLAVKNTNNPDVPRVLSTPRGAEAVAAKLFQQQWNAQNGNFGGIGVQAMALSFESHSQLANNGLGSRAAIPRQAISNAFGNSEQTENLNDFDKLTRNSRSAANAIRALQGFVKANNSTGSKARDARAISFAFFNLGYGLANTAMIYDSAAIITPEVPSDVVPPLSPASAVMTVALAMLDSAIAISNSAAATDGADGWPLPADWVSGNSNITIARWQQIIHSYKARFRASAARSPTDVVDWNAVVADAAAGITSDFIVNADAAAGWSNALRNQLSVDATWSQMTPMILGMADTTLAYDAWLAQPLNAKTPFLMHTPDKRFPAGDTRAQQNTASGAPSKTGTPPGSILYFYNRVVGDDKTAFSWGTWFYDNQRFWGVRANAQNGPLVALSKAENDLLRAEGLIKTNQVAAAIPLINLTRTRAGLVAIPANATATQPVPGNAGCVPRVPQAPNFTTTACGTVFEALKWEKRVETSFTGYGQWYFDSRRWGDLTKGTILEWPVPYQELFARQNLTIYTTSNLAAAGTYGCPGPASQCP